MTIFTRKSKVEMQQLTNEDEIVNVTICIESNHVNSNLDSLMLALTNNVTVLNNYKPKEKKATKVKKPKKKDFGGNYV